MIMYAVYQIGLYSTPFVNGQAVVAANSIYDAADLLKKHLKNDRGTRECIREGDLGLRIDQERVVDTGIRADKRGVLFPFH